MIGIISVIFNIYMCCNLWLSSLCNCEILIKSKYQYKYFKSQPISINYVTYPHVWTILKTFLIMTSIVDLRCYTKFDWLGKYVKPIKFHVAFTFAHMSGPFVSYTHVYIICMGNTVWRLVHALKSYSILDSKKVTLGRKGRSTYCREKDKQLRSRSVTVTRSTP